MPNPQNRVADALRKYGKKIGTFALKTPYSEIERDPEVRKRREEAGLWFESPTILCGNKHRETCVYDNSKLEVVVWHWQGESGKMILPREPGESFMRAFYQCPNCHVTYDLPVDEEEQRRMDRYEKEHPFMIKAIV
jgi:hypothetical protein